MQRAGKRAQTAAAFYVEFRVRHPDGSLHWLAGKGQVDRARHSRPVLARRTLTTSPSARRSKRGCWRVNETLEARVAEVARGSARPRSAQPNRRRGGGRARSGTAGPDGDRCRRRTEPRAVRRILLQRHQRRRRSLYALHAFGRAARGLREVSDAAQHGDLRADLPRSRAGALRRHSGRSALRQERALSRHARRAICRCAAIWPCRSFRGRAKCLAASSSAMPQPAFSPSAPNGS